jgi:hypothetical protein
MPIKHLKYGSDEELVKKTANTLENHSANDEDLAQMKHWLDTFSRAHKVDVSMKHEEEIKGTENRLGKNIPKALRLAYSYFGSNEDILSPEIVNKLFCSDSRLLKLNELKIEQGIAVHDGYTGEALYETDILVYCVDKKSKSVDAVDMEKDWVLGFSNKNKKWYWVKDYFPLYKLIVIELVNIAITRKKYIFKTSVKGMGVPNALDKKFAGDLERFKDFVYHAYHPLTLYCNPQNGALGWLHNAYNAPSLVLGCDDKAFVDGIIKKHEFGKAKMFAK